eukprot:tig00021070_g17872.t2
MPGPDDDGPLKETSVRVALRARPLLSSEVLANCRECVTYNDAKSITIGKDRGFTFDYVYHQESTQRHIYEECVSPLVQACFAGYNATVLAYGQTGSGKTYTMGSGNSANLLEHEVGIIPRVIKELFATIEKKKGEADFTLRVSFIEIHNEELRDLLDPATAVQRKLGSTSRTVSIREDPNGGIFLTGVREEAVTTEEEMAASLERGTLSRTTGSTQMNERSSRSHAIFTVMMEQRSAVDPSDPNAIPEYMTSKFHFVDLAGSERLKRTKAEGERLKEGIHINSGLLALGNVISALGDERRIGCHVPYRDSKLTRMLQDSLGGNSKTLMIACVSPADINFEESLNTLKYANRARNIKNKPVVNRDPNSAQLVSLRKEIERLQAELLRTRQGDYFLLDGGDSDVLEELQRLKEANGELEKQCSSLRVELERAKQSAREAKEERTSAVRERDLYRLKLEEAARGGAVELPEGYSNEGVLEEQLARIRELENENEKLQDELQDKMQQLRIAEETLAQDELIFGEKMREISILSRARSELEEELMRLGSHDPVSVSLLSAAPPTTVAAAAAAVATAAASNATTPSDPSQQPPPPPQPPGGGQAAAAAPSGSRQGASPAATPAVTRIRRERSQRASPAPRSSSGVVSPTESGPSEADGPAGEGSGSGAGAGGEQHEDGLSEGESYATGSVEEGEIVSSTDDDLMSDTRTREYEVQQQVLEKTVRDLSTNIARKEQLIAQLTRTSEELRAMQNAYEMKIKDLESEIERTQLEMLRVQAESSAKTESEKRAVRQQYEQTLAQLETQLKELKKKQGDRSTVSKMQQQHEQRIGALQQDILELKKQKIAFQRKLKEEKDQYQEYISKCNQEISQLRRQQAKTNIKLKLLEQDNAKKEALLKRRVEETSAMRRRLHRSPGSSAAPAPGPAAPATLSLPPSGSGTPPTPRAPALPAAAPAPALAPPPALPAAQQLAPLRQGLFTSVGRMDAWLNREVDVWVRKNEVSDSLKSEQRKRDQLLADQEYCKKAAAHLQIKRERRERLPPGAEPAEADVLTPDEELQLAELEERMETIDAELDFTAMRMSEARQLAAPSPELPPSLPPSFPLRFTTQRASPPVLNAARSRVQDLAECIEASDQLFNTRLEQMSPQEHRRLIKMLFARVVRLKGAENSWALQTAKLQQAFAEQKTTISEMTNNLHIAEVEYDKRLTILEEEHEEKLLFLLQQIDAANHAARVSGGPPGPPETVTPPHSAEQLSGASQRLLQLKEEQISILTKHNAKYSATNQQLQAERDELMGQVEARERGLAARSNEIDRLQKQVEELKAHCQQLQHAAAAAAHAPAQPPTLVVAPSPSTPAHTLAHAHSAPDASALSCPPSSFRAVSPGTPGSLHVPLPAAASAPPEEAAASARSAPARPQASPLDTAGSYTARSSGSGGGQTARRTGPLGAVSGTGTPKAGAAPSEPDGGLGEAFRCVKSMGGHTGFVLALACSDATETLFSSSQDSTIKVWDLTRCEEVGVLRGHNGFVRCVSVTPDGRYLFSGAQDSTIRMWDTRSNACVKVLQGHQREIYSIVAHNNMIFSGSEDNTVRVWSQETLTPVKSLTGHKSTVFSLAANGRNLFSGSRDHSIKVWDLATLEMRKTLHPPHLDGVNAFALTPTSLFSGSRDKSIKQWDLNGFQATRSRMAAHADWISSLLVAAEPRLLISASRDSTIKVWDLDAPVDVLASLDDHKGPVNSIVLSRNLLLSCSNDRTIKVWVGQ